jgi:hypothetical protein
MVLGIAGLIMIPADMFTFIPEWVGEWVGGLYFPLMTSAVVLGHVSRRRVDGRPGLETASSMAGLITGYIGLGLLFLFFGLTILSSPFT